jgi:hypothetical protein
VATARGAAERTRRGQPLGREGSGGHGLGMWVVPGTRERTLGERTSDHCKCINHKALEEVGREEKAVDQHTDQHGSYSKQEGEDERETHVELAFEDHRYRIVYTVGNRPTAAPLDLRPMVRA